MNLAKAIVVAVFLMLILGAQVALPIVSAQTDAAPALVKGLPNDARRTYLSPPPLSVSSIEADSRAMAPADYRIDHLMVLLRTTVERDRAATAYIASMSDPKSPNYGRSLTLEELADRFDASPRDIAAVTQWLKSEGLRIRSIAPDNRIISFMGDARSVSKAFKTQIYLLDLGDGRKQPVAVSTPSVPSALAPAIKNVFPIYGVRNSSVTQ